SAWTAILDAKTMTKRSLTLSLRNPDTLLTSVVTPMLMMILFVYVLGGAIDIGATSYVNYIVPGIILQCIGQCAATTALNVHSDIKNGVLDRFRSMPITQSSVLIGHVIESVLRNMLTAFIITVVALLIGFSPSASILGWLGVILILVMYSLAISWFSVLFGLIANSAAGASTFSMLLVVLPYLSSGFVPTGTMPEFLAAIAQHQPMTPIIDAMRAMLQGGDIQNNLLIATFWCVGLFIVGFIAAMRVYRKKLLK
ncbi:MAG: ABC transporter permease, partial [Sporomusa sp.]